MGETYLELQFKIFIYCECYFGIFHLSPTGQLSFVLYLHEGSMEQL